MTLPTLSGFGIWSLVTSTLMTSLTAMLVALPIGLSVAIYLSEYASHRARSVLKPIMEVLAGIPTVVYGYFALTFIWSATTEPTPESIKASTFCIHCGTTFGADDVYCIGCGSARDAATETVARLLQLVQTEENMELREASSQALGALNLPADPARDLILNLYGG